METIFDKIKEVITQKRGHYGFELISETLIQKDLGIYGDDASEFFDDIGKKFDIDLSNFPLNEYFIGEGGLVWLMKLLGDDVYKGKKELTIGDLERIVLNAISVK